MSTIANLATKAVETLRADSPRARERLCDEWDVARALRLHLRACRIARCTHPDAVIRTTLRGGYVTNNYKYPADADNVTITGGYVRDLAIEAKRGFAQSRRDGRGSVLVIRRVSPDQTDGTIVDSR